LPPIKPVLVSVYGAIVPRKALVFQGLPSNRGIPIKSVRYQDDDLTSLKTDLINACLRQAEWVNRYSYTLETKPLDTPDDLWRTGHYCLKTYSHKTGLDFLEVIDWDNSDLKATKGEK
jgi:hypothetical protein